MARRIPNLPNNNSPDQQSDNAMSQLYAASSYWINNEQRISESLSETFSLKVDPVPQKGRCISFQIQDQDSSSTQSTQSDHDLAVTGGTTSQDQSISSESAGQEVGGGKGAEGQVKPLLQLGHPNVAYKPTSQICFSHPTACMPYADTEPYFNGLLNPYGQALPMIQPQIVGMQPARVPLPLDIAEDEPIYVNAKQYHGILRRRQSRAKLEAQNKLIKVRKPYLHESRHLHALNRVRGSGGRFLSTNKKKRSALSFAAGTHSPPSSAAPQKDGNRSGHEQYQSLGMETSSPLRSSFQLSSLSSRSSIFQQSDHMFLGMTRGGGGAMEGTGEFMNNPNRHHASVVR